MGRLRCRRELKLRIGFGYWTGCARQTDGQSGLFAGRGPPRAGESDAGAKTLSLGAACLHIAGKLGLVRPLAMGTLPSLSASSSWMLARVAWDMVRWPGWPGPAIYRATPSRQSARRATIRASIHSPLAVLASPRRGEPLLAGGPAWPAGSMPNTSRLLHPVPSWSPMALPALPGRPRRSGDNSVSCSGVAREASWPHLPFAVILSAGRSSPVIDS